MKIYLVSENESYSHEVNRPETSIGRAETNHFCVPSLELSRQHCILYMENDRLHIVDVGSKNGVFVDGIRIPVNEKFEVTIRSLITLSKIFNLCFYRKPEHTNLTRALTLEPIPVRTPKK